MLTRREVEMISFSPRTGPDLLHGVIIRIGGWNATMKAKRERKMREERKKVKREEDAKLDLVVISIQTRWGNILIINPSPPLNLPFPSFLLPFLLSFILFFRFLSIAQRRKLWICSIRMMLNQLQFWWCFQGQHRKSRCIHHQPSPMSNGGAKGLWNSWITNLRSSHGWRSFDTSHSHEIWKR